jgi:hypothetical protein
MASDPSIGTGNTTTNTAIGGRSRQKSNETIEWQHWRKCDKASMIGPLCLTPGVNRSSS